MNTSFLDVLVNALLFILLVGLLFIFAGVVIHTSEGETFGIECQLLTP